MSPARVIEGQIEQIRIAVPATRHDFFLRINGEIVNGGQIENRQLNELGVMLATGTRVKIGVIPEQRGRNVFCWAVPAKGDPIPPRYYKDQLANGWSFGLKCLGVAAVSLLLAWLFGIDSFPRTLLMTLSLTVALVALVMGSGSFLAIWHNYRSRPSILASEALFAQNEKRPPPGPALGAPPARAAVTAQAMQDEGDPPIAYVRGVLHELSHEHRSVHKGPSYAIYRFTVNDEAYAMYAGENYGDPLPFLSDGDGVELAVYAGPAKRDRRDVYAMRNLEDGRVYMCHQHFRSTMSSMAPVGVGMNQRAGMLKMLGGLMFATWLVIAGCVYFTDGDADGGQEMLTIATVVCVGAWLLFALPLLFLDTRWRMGKPTRRQRITERIYRVLGLGTPFAPEQHIENV